MAASKTPIVRPPIGSVDWEGLAWLMRIPNHRRELFIDWLQTCIKEEWEDAAIPPEKVALWRRVERINADIARTGRAFIRAVEQRRALSTPSDERKRAELLAKYLKAEMAAEPLKWLSNREIIMAVGNYIQSENAPQRGAPKRPNRFAAFLEYTLYVACALGGRVSFNRKTGKGNVVDLLVELRPIMPPRLIPKALPMPLIERLSTKAHGLMVRTASSSTPGIRATESVH